MTVASTPNSDSVRVSRSAVFALASLFGRRPRRRRTQQASVGQAVLRVLGRRVEHGLDALELGLVLGNERRLRGANGRSDDVGISLGAVEQPVLRLDRRSDSGESNRSPVCDSVDGHSNARRAPVPARCTTCPVRRRIAPVDAPLTSRKPADEQRAADDGGARVADQCGERAADREPDEAARVLAEQAS